jgi:hypothetical protein
MPKVGVFTVLNFLPGISNLKLSSFVVKICEVLLWLELFSQP